MKYERGYRQLFSILCVALLLGGCGGSKSNSDTAPVAVPPNSPVVAALSITTDSHSATTIPGRVVAESNVAVTNWASNFFTVSGTCTTLPTPSLTLDASSKIITATLSGGTCSAGQSLILTIDPKAIAFASAVSDSGVVWTRTYTIPALAQVVVGGNISGLTGTLVLRNNGGDDQTISTDGHFAFPTAVEVGAAYAVTVQTQPAGQTCSVGNGSGTAGAVDVNDIAIVCSANAYRIGFTVSGLAGSLVLQNNAGDDQTINSDGTFAFAASIAHGATYAVTVLTQPAGQTCSVANGSGVIGIADVTNVTVVCSANTYTVGGALSGVSGTVVLQNNGADNLTRSSNGSFTFSTPVAEGSTYNVTVQTQPASQSCTVSNGSGTMGGSNVTNVGVYCTTNTTTLSVDATGTIPVNGASGSITVTNTGMNTAHNVSAALPGGWSGVTQDASSCASIPPGSSCTLSFTSTTPYVAQGSIQVTGDNIDTPPETALAFTVQGYLVFAISGGNASVIDSSDLASLSWSSLLVTTGAQSLTDGVDNTNTIVSNLGSSASAAAVACSNSANGGAAVGTWYLPAICQMGGSGGTAGCASGDANIDANLVQLGFGGLDGNTYWSSSERSSFPMQYAYSQYFLAGGGSIQIIESKPISLSTRCVRSIAY